MNDTLKITQLETFLSELENETYSAMEKQDLHDSGRIENQGVLDTIELIQKFLNNPEKYLNK